MYLPLIYKNPIILSLLIIVILNFTIYNLTISTLFRMGIFGAAHGWVGKEAPPLSKIPQKYPTMIKLGTAIYTLPKEDPKSI